MNIGVFGSSAGDDMAEVLAREIGVAIAKSGHTVVTGAALGVPYEAVLGALSVHGSTIGFSPHATEDDHRAAGRSVEDYTKIIYIPEDYENKDNVKICMKYRNVSSVAFCDAAVIVNGRIGTLNEFTNAFDMGKIIGVLKGSGGSADSIIPELLARNTKPTDAVVIFESDPKLLVQKIIEQYEK